MPLRKSPAADVRRRYRLHAEIGLALALGATILAFTVPIPSSEAAPISLPPVDPVPLEPIPPTEHPPQPPPPPAPPPPVAVSDGEEILDEILPLLDLPAFALAPPSPPAAPATAEITPPPPVAPPPPPAEALTHADEVWVVVERPPVLIGGIEALQRRVAYPARAEIEGRVVVQFVVDERGRVVDPVAVRSPHPLLTEAALAAVRESRFEPGQQQGRPVKVRFTVPVTFRLR